MERKCEVGRERAKWINQERTLQAQEKASSKAPGQTVSEAFEEASVVEQSE